MHSIKRQKTLKHGLALKHAILTAKDACIFSRFRTTIATQNEMLKMQGTYAGH